MDRNGVEADAVESNVFECTGVAGDGVEEPGAAVTSNEGSASPDGMDGIGLAVDVVQSDVVGTTLDGVDGEPEG